MTTKAEARATEERRSRKAKKLRSSKARSKELALTEGGGSEVGAADFATDGPPLVAVDVRDVPDAEHPEEEHYLLTGESWVILGEDPSVPEQFVGEAAAVIDSPVGSAYGEDDELLYTYTPPDAIITVRVRSQGNVLSVPLSSCRKVAYTGGRSAVINFP